MKVNTVLHHEVSKFQDVLVFNSTSHGNVLALDGIIQCTEFDEFCYQEMISHLPLNAHACPKKVPETVIIGVNYRRRRWWRVARSMQT